jgi:hypothetical protein
MPRKIEQYLFQDKKGKKEGEKMSASSSARTIFSICGEMFRSRKK